MFNPALEMVLNVAFREAMTRRHAHLGLEHLLYAVLHDPSGEEILRACGADLERLGASVRRHLEERVEALPRGSELDPVQTLAFRRREFATVDVVPEPHSVPGSAPTCPRQSTQRATTAQKPCSSATSIT